MNKIWLGIVVGLFNMQLDAATSAKTLKREHFKNQMNACMQELLKKLQQAGKNIENNNIQQQTFHACLDWKRHGLDPVKIAQQIEIK